MEVIYVRAQQSENQQRWCEPSGGERRRTETHWSLDWSTN